MKIKHLIPPREKNLGDFTVRRLLPYSKQRMVGPWIFFDHIGPADFPAGKGIDVRPHPHINLATVTYLFEGEILHRDSLGSVQKITPGDINLMIAGKGIVHSERESEEVRNSNHRTHGIQLWHALPEEYEEMDPEFHHYGSSELPHLSKDRVNIRVMMGSAYGLKSPVKTFGQVVYIEAEMAQDSQLELPNAEELAIYVADGEVQVEKQNLEKYQMATLEPNAKAVLQALKDSRIVLIGGKKNVRTIY